MAAVLDVTQGDGPHSPERTAATANLIADAVRFLNYATMPADNAPGISYPGDVDRVLGSLASAATGLQQTLGQCADSLRSDLAAGGLRLDPGRPFADHPAAAVDSACFSLEQAVAACGNLRAALDAARRTTAGMSMSDGEED